MVVICHLDNQSPKLLLLWYIFQAGCAKGQCVGSHFMLVLLSLALFFAFVSLCLTFVSLASSLEYNHGSTNLFVIMIHFCCVNYSFTSKDLVSHCPLWRAFFVQFSRKQTGEHVR